MKFQDIFEWRRVFVYNEKQEENNSYIIYNCIVVRFVVCGFDCNTVYFAWKKQSKQISELLSKTEYLEEKLRQTTDYYDFETEYKQDSFNCLAIGNSLTLITSWGRGICSTQPDNDYFNLIVKELKNQHGDVVAYPYNFAPWEKAAKRDSALDLIDVYLSDKLDLVTIQLGENAGDITTYEQDLENLINYVREKAPKAQIIVIGDWWSKEKNDMRIEAAKNCGCEFADLSDVIGNSKYQSKTGLTCYLSDGTTINVSEEASTHPGDLGMEYIAKKVIKLIK